MADGTNHLSPRVSRTCDECKTRKVRCHVQSTFTSCVGCLRRGTPCHFGYTKRRLKRTGGTKSPNRNFPSATAESSTSEQPSKRQCLSTCYIDRLLDDPQTGGISINDSCMFKADEHNLTSSNLAFFSESRILLMSERLGHTKLRELVETITAVIDSRLNRSSGPNNPLIRFRVSSVPIEISRNDSFTFINAYFDHFHPSYPFLDRIEFEQIALAPTLPGYLMESPAFSALYHTVLALGCQYTGEGSFDPGKGQAWKLYQAALGLLPDVLLPGEMLVNLQAIAAMALYALNLSCIQIEETLISEAARMAQCLGYHRMRNAGGKEATCYRTFWVIYSLEKMVCFFTGRSPVLADFDIGSPIPEAPDATFGGLDFFLKFIQCSRLFSKAYQTLFSISATMCSADEYNTAIGLIDHDLERWRISIPAVFRPGEPFKPSFYHHLCVSSMTLRLHYVYFALCISLCRLTLHVNDETSQVDFTKKRLLVSARTVIQLTTNIDTQPFTPIWMLGTVPLSAMFVIFDFVIYNPVHPETDFNLALLDLAAGYFSRLEFATGSSFPTSHLSGFAHIANEYVRKQQCPSVSVVTTPVNNSSLDTRQAVSPPSTSHDPPSLSLHDRGHYPNRLEPTDGGIPPDSDGFSSISLCYPSTNTQVGVDGPFLAGLDFTNLFDMVIPDIES